MPDPKVSSKFASRKKKCCNDPESPSIVQSNGLGGAYGADIQLIDPQSSRTGVWAA